jgi:integrase
MTEQAISPLRRRMIEDMSIRKFAAKTQHDYVQRVKDFAAFLGRSPDTAKSEDVRGFRLHLASSGAGTPKINATVSALRFFFKVTLDRPELAKHLAFMHEPRKVPVVLSPEEVARFLEAAPGIKYKAALSVAYGAGLRVCEVVSLKVSDIDSKRMMLRVEQGKGRKDRHAMLSPVLLELLRDWYRIARPQGWLFPGQNPVNPMTTRQLTRLPSCRSHGRAYQAGDATHLAPQLRDAPARTEHRYSGDPSPAGSRQTRDDGALHARRHQHDPRGHEPARPSHAAAAQEGRDQRRDQAGD